MYVPRQRSVKAGAVTTRLDARARPLFGTTGARSATPTMSPIAGMASANAPPFLLPGEHFAAALLFLLAGSAGVFLVSGDLANGAYLSPRVASVTHLFTLGWITTSIMGALYQFLPVALGKPIGSVRLAHLTFLLYVPGLCAFVSGLVLFRTTLMLVGAAMFGTGILLFVGNVAATLRASERRDVTWWALGCAVAFLVITLVFGVALAGNLRWGYLGAGRVTSLGVHLHVAVAGWVLLVMIGVAHRLLPMFLLSHGAGNRFAKAAVALVAAGAGVLAFLHHASRLVSFWLPAILIASGCVAFLLQARAFYARRHRPVLDPGMRLAAAALSLLGVALVLSTPVLLSVANARLSTAYVLAVLLAISLFIAAHYYKIVPFLVWYHRFGPLAGKRPVPRVSDLYSARIATLAAGALVVGAAGLIGAVVFGMPVVARTAALVFACGVVIESAQMVQLWRTRP
ncbi:MAG TPA: hypothetical protein VHG09_08225 [Longimicrobiales bacterium]|nr:hypothetical protein [Longimicrobiales bacterium]